MRWKPRSPEGGQRIAEIAHDQEGHVLEAAGGGFRQDACRRRAVAGRRDDGLHVEGRSRADDGAHIVRIGDLVESQHDAGAAQGVDGGRGQGIGLESRAPGGRRRAREPVDLVRTDDLRLDRQGRPVPRSASARNSPSPGAGELCAFRCGVPRRPGASRRGSWCRSRSSGARACGSRRPDFPCRTLEFRLAGREGAIAHSGWISVETERGT